MGSYNSANDFRSDVEEHFRYLVTEFGFELIPPVSDFLVTYRNASTLVSIEAGGYGFRVSVGLGRVERDRYELERYPLDKLLLIRERDLALVGLGGFPTNNDQEYQVAHYAKALRQHGADVLQGDFEIWPAFRKKAWPRQRAQNKGGKKKSAKR